MQVSEQIYTLRLLRNVDSASVCRSEVSESCVKMQLNERKLEPCADE